MNYFKLTKYEPTAKCDNDQRFGGRELPAVTFLNLPPFCLSSQLNTGNLEMTTLWLKPAEQCGNQHMIHNSSLKPPNNQFTNIGMIYARGVTEYEYIIQDDQIICSYVPYF